MKIEEMVRSARTPRRPLPIVSVEHGPAIPGWSIHILFSLVAGGAVLLAGLRTPAPTALVATVAAILGAWAVWRPRRGPAHLAAVLCALALLGAGGGPFDPAVFWIAPLAYVAVRLGWWAEHVGWSARVETATLRRTGGRDLVVITGTLLIGAVAWVVAGTPVGALVLAGTGALLGGTWYLLRR